MEEFTIIYRILKILKDMMDLMVRPEITLKGLEYLEQNGLMKRAANIAKGIKSTIPGL